MFWLEAHVLLEMAAVMTPSRADMAKIFDKFFREESGFFLADGVEERQVCLYLCGKQAGCFLREDGWGSVITFCMPQLSNPWPRGDDVSWRAWGVGEG